jgi:hypothetical protein
VELLSAVQRIAGCKDPVPLAELIALFLQTCVYVSLYMCLCMYVCVVCRYRGDWLLSSVCVWRDARTRCLSPRSSHSLCPVDVRACTYTSLHVCMCVWIRVCSGMADVGTVCDPRVGKTCQRLRDIVVGGARVPMRHAQVHREARGGGTGRTQAGQAGVCVCVCVCVCVHACVRACVHTCLRVG